MKRAMTVLMTAALLAGSGVAAFAGEGGNWFDRGIPVAQSDKLGLSIWARGQLSGVGEIVPDPYADHLRIYEFLKQARMGFNGHYEDLFNYQIELGYGGENQNSLQSMAGSYDLMDFVADIPLRPFGEHTILKVGQFRVPYGRENLVDEGYMDWEDKSIANMAVNQGRDFGLAIEAQKDKFIGTVGTFPGGGRDIAQRYLPERFGFPEIVARVGWNDGVDEDIYHVMGTDRNLKRETKAIYLSGLYTMDTRVGHSTALKSHTVDNNLLVDTNYNPYIVRGLDGKICSAITCDRGHMYLMGTDAVIRKPLGNGQAVEAEVEGNWGGYWNRAGVIHIASGRGQVDYQVGPWEFGARYGILSLDKKAGYTSATATAGNSSLIPGTQNLSYYRTNMGQPIHEVGPSITYHFKGHNLKLVADLPIFINAPLMIDRTDGVYAFEDGFGEGSQMADMVSVLSTAGNSVPRRTYGEGRMLLQFQF